MAAKALLVFGARPNFMKIAPLYREMRARGTFHPVLVHTGQHFDKAMSDDFIQALELPRADVHLGIGAGTQAWQIARVLETCESVLRGLRPDMVVTVGDVNSTIGAALAASTLGIPIAHVEAGLRSHDWEMPEERNRVLTDRVSRFLFTPSEDANANLRAEGIDERFVHLVGNIMIDSLDWMLPRVQVADVLKASGVADRPYAVVTLHRPSNVDRPNVLAGLMEAFAQLSKSVPVLFPVHPRTRQRLDEMDGEVRPPATLRLLPPLGYMEFLGLLSMASVILTDSGGIQEEATVLGVPCLTLRENTERPITTTLGSNQVVGVKPSEVIVQARRVLLSPRPQATRPPLWDGRTAERILRILEDSFA